MINSLLRATFSLFLGVLFFASCTNSSRFTVNIEGLPEDSLVCSYVTLEIIREGGRMSSYMVGGERSADSSSVSFDIDLLDGDQLYKVFLMPQSYAGDGPNQNMEFFMIPGESLHIDATYEPKRKVIDYTISGSDVQQAWQEHSKAFEHLQHKLEMTSMMMTMLFEQSAMRDSLIQQRQVLRDSINRIKSDYIGANPKEQLAAYYLTAIDDIQSIDSLYHLLDDGVKNGPLKGWLDMQNEMVERVIASQSAYADSVRLESAPVDSLD